MEVVGDRDALLELRQLAQPLRPLRLADQDQRQQVAVVQLEVEQQTQLFERARILDRLRLVDDHHRVPAAPVAAEQRGIELVENLELGLGNGVDAELE